MRCFDDDDGGVLPFGPGPALGEQRDVADDDGVRRRLVDPLTELLDDRGPRDAVEREARFLVGERSPREAGTVEVPVRKQDVVAEAPASAASAGFPGSTTARAATSASTTTAPLRPRRSAAVDLPDPIPPVRPTSNMV